jgi:presenilin-like A22 family membrane protease
MFRNNTRLFLELSVIFVAAQLLGIAVGMSMIAEGTRVVIVSENPEDVSNTLALFVMILAFTAVLLILLSLKMGTKLVRLFELIAVFGATFIAFDALFSEVAFMFAFLLVLSRIVLKEDLLLKNIVSVFTVAGVAGLFGASFGLLPVFIFVVLLAIYDALAVFWTKHMIKMAQGIVKENLAMTFSLPSKNHTFQLGTGDIVVPVVFSIAAMQNSFNLGTQMPTLALVPLAIGLSALAALIWTLNYCAKHRVALPALPPQVFAMLVALLILRIAGI